MSLPRFRNSVRSFFSRSAWRVAFAGASLAVVACISSGHSIAQAGGREAQPVPAPVAEATTDRYIIKLRDPSADIGARLPAIAAAKVSTKSAAAAFVSEAPYITVSEVSGSPLTFRTP